MNVQLRSTAYHRRDTGARAHQPDRQAKTPPQMRNYRADIYRMCCRATKSEAQIAGMIRRTLEGHRRKTPLKKYVRVRLRKFPVPDRNSPDFVIRVTPLPPEDSTTMAFARSGT